MILRDNLYRIVSKDEANGMTTVRVSLNPECFIYKAHFPGNPITPGVCIIQTANELLEDIEGRKLTITEVKDVKFLNILSPVSNQDVDFVFTSIDHPDDSSIKAKVNVMHSDEVFTTINFATKDLP